MDTEQAGVISERTAERIWIAYREIKAGEKILADIEKKKAEYVAPRDEYAPTLTDAFGRKQYFQLGIPSGENGHRLLDVSPVLAESCIRAHIQQQRQRLAEANEAARIELLTVTA